MDADVRAELDDLRMRVARLEDALARRGAPITRTWESGADPEVLELLRRGSKIEAIKRYREITGLGLAEAKHAVERLEAGL